MKTPLANYILDRLPADYRVGNEDLKWLNTCAEFYDGKATNVSVLEAVHEAFAVHGNDFHIDPYELLIDARICTPDLKPLL